MELWRRTETTKTSLRAWDLTGYFSEASQRSHWDLSETSLRLYRFLIVAFVGSPDLTDI